MRCPECGGEINENDIICSGCGAEIINASEAAYAEPDEREEQDVPQKRGRKAGKNGTEKNKKRRLIIIVRAAAAVLIIAAIAVLCVIIAGNIRASKGRKIFDGVPLGRDVEYIGTQVGAEFAAAGASEYGAVNHIAGTYNYVCEAEKSVTVDGIPLPEWVVLLSENGGAVTEAKLYNFSVLKHGWMGERTADMIDPSTAVEFGSTVKAAERSLGLKPYAIIKESGSNTSTYVYRYHYTDSQTGSNCVKNIYVVANDVDGKVGGAYDETLDYLGLILGADMRQTPSL